MMSLEEEPGTTTTQALRHSAAEKAYQSYDFGVGVIVEDQNGWEYQTPGKEMSRRVFVRHASSDGCQPTEMMTFVVGFVEGGASVKSSYAMSQGGNIVGKEVVQQG